MKTLAAARWTPALLLAAGVVAVLAASLRTPADASDAEAAHDVDVLLLFPGNPATHRYLAIHVLLSRPDDADLESVLVETRAAVVAEFPGAIDVTRDGGVTAQYQYPEDEYWWTAAMASWAYNPAGQPSGLAGVAHGVIIDAADAWDFAGGSPWRYTGGTSLTSAAPCSASGDGVNAVGWFDFPLAHILGETCVWVADGDDPPAPAVEFDIRLDTDAEWTTGTNAVVDLFTVALHEFGHGLGLGHPARPCSGAVMCASYTDGTRYSGPQPDDVAGVVARYGGPTATATSTVSVSPTVTSTPTPPLVPVDSAIAPALAHD